MDLFENLMLLIPIISVLELLTIIFSILFMHYSAKHRNHQLSVGWYICGFLFGICTLIVFLVKRKDFPGPETKVCYQCGRKFPDSFQMCSNCLIDLPVIAKEEKEKQRKLTKIFGAAVIVTLTAVLITGIASGFLFAKEIIEDPFSGLLGEDNRISVGGVFYDKKGNSYDQWDKVILYDEENRTYTYTVEEPENTEDELFALADYYYVRDDGEKYFTYDCYVSEDGWFYCDKGGLLEIVTEDTASMSEEELDEYYNSLLEAEDSEYRYYDYAYKDKNGKIYYSADEASWNEKGVLITAENDVSLKE
ncbi:MAG: hypothetical protein IJO73_09525 [Clostridia bacterium]|nr:hypothetical protein [Clostridia bacterium]